MSLVYRLEKGAPLTLTEMDGNFRFLEEKISDHDTQISTLKGISHIAVEDGDLIFQNDREDELYRVSMPLPSFHHQGAWQPGKSYMYGNVISHSGTTYICLSAHTASTWQTDEQKWLFLATSHPQSGFISVSSDEDADMAAAASAAAAERSSEAERGVILPGVPIIPRDHLPVAVPGKLVVVALDSAPGFALALGVSDGWMNVTTGKKL